MVSHEAFKIGRDRAHVLDVIDEEDVTILKNQISSGRYGIIRSQRGTTYSEKLYRKAQRVIFLIGSFRRCIARPARPCIVGAACPETRTKFSRTVVRHSDPYLGDAVLLTKDGALRRLLAVVDTDLLKPIDKQVSRLFDGLDETAMRLSGLRLRVCCKHVISFGILKRSHGPPNQRPSACQKECSSFRSPPPTARRAVSPLGQSDLH